MFISLDGVVAGPNQDLENPFGVGGLELHHWHPDDPVHEADANARDSLMKRRGACVMGRNMFGPTRGEWDQDWCGWWGDEPRYDIAGGASTVRRALQAGAINELMLDVPVLLGAGERLFDGVADAGLHPTEAISPKVTHVNNRVGG
jgi:dihydrofolate reductase